MNQRIFMLLAACVALYCTNWIFPKVLHIAKLKRLVDNPDARKLQKTPVPLLGGLAVFFGMLMGVLAFNALSGCEQGMLLPLLLSVGVMLYVGLIDDIIGLSPRARIIIEVLTMLGLIYGSGMCIDSLHGLWGVNTFSWWVAVPLTVFAGVGLINAYNMVDGVNGLSSGLCIAVCAILCVIFWKRLDYANCVLALCFCVSLIPFLLHNVFGKRSKMFIGDGGTMVMGLLVSWFVIRVLSSDNVSPMQTTYDQQLGLVAMMLAVASVPVFDTLRVMTMRMLKGQSPFSPDKTHLHHAFIAVGMSHSITALSEIVINALVVGVWYTAYKCGWTVDAQLYATIGASVLLVWGTYLFLRSQYKYNTVLLEHIKRFTAMSHLGHTRWWLAYQAWLDKGTYEDYRIILHDRLKKQLENMSETELDEATIVNYLHGKSKVRVEEVVSGCHLEHERVQTAIAELKEAGVLEVKKRHAETGVAEVVKLILNAI